MAAAVLTLFVVALFACVASGTTVLGALAFGLVLFCAYARLGGNRWGDVWGMCATGVRSVGNILAIFALIGMMTALWRACGTISAIVAWSVPLIHPAAVPLAVFLLNCLMSFLTGTSFGTSATMGVICMALATSMGTDPAIAGGAVLGGAFFGDRCSPMSSSAALVCSLTKTDIFENVRIMARTAVVPFVATCVIYGLLGALLNAGETDGAPVAADIVALFEGVFDIGWPAFVPAVLVLVLAVARVDVKAVMLASIACAFVLCVCVQGMDVRSVLATLVGGYACPDAQVARMLDGGGLLSMVEVGAIVCISSAYAGIFQGTGLLDGLRSVLERLAKRTTPFAAVLASSAVTNAVACNQTLSTILTQQLCDGIEKDGRHMMIDLEDSVILLAALVPWSIAATVPLTTIGAPIAGIAFAFYLYLQPLWRLTPAGNRGLPSR